MLVHQLKEIRSKLSVIILSTGLVILMIVIGIYFIQNTADKHLDDLAALTADSGNAALSAMQRYADENLRLTYELAAAQKSAADWQAYAANVSASVVYVPEYHEQTTVKEVAVAKPVYVNGDWREFESLAVLAEWAKTHLAYILPVGSQSSDCDDYAQRLQTEAYKDGYLLSVQLITGGMLNGKNISNYTQVHMGNLAMVGNSIYFIEPQPEYFRVVFVCNRD
jgi:hypothetical protein